MRENDAVFFNLHRPYLAYAPPRGCAGIYQISAFLQENGYFAQGFTGTLEEGLERLERAASLRGGKKFLLGLYCDYANVTENVFFARHAKERYGCPVIVGGPQALALGADFFRESLCEAVVLGEGELTVLALADHFFDGTGELGEIAGVAYLEGGEVKRTKPRPLIENLDALPLVTEDCRLGDPPPLEELWLMTGRGCPFGCAFCHEGNSPYAWRTRFRSPENVLAEIDAFLERAGGRPVRILFTDDTFTLDPGRVRAVCQGLKERREKYEIEWFCEGHVHTLFRHPEMLEDLAAAGLGRLQLGIEALTEGELAAYRKGSTAEEVFAVVRRAAALGVGQIFGNLILGGAGFSRAVYAENLRRAKELLAAGEGALELGVVSFWPLPNTAITRNPQEYGIRILDYDFDEAADDFPQTETAELSRWEIAALMREMQEELSRHMRLMLKEGAVPLRRIKKWLDSRENRFEPQWRQELGNDPALYRYYFLLAKQGGLALAALGGDWAAAHPARTSPLYQCLSVKADGTAEAAGAVDEKIPLSRWEREALLLATGRHDSEWIRERLGQRGYAVDLGGLRRLWERLEKARLLGFLPR